MKLLKNKYALIIFTIILCELILIPFDEHLEMSGCSLLGEIKLHSQLEFVKNPENHCGQKVNSEGFVGPIDDWGSNIRFDEYRVVISGGSVAEQLVVEQRIYLEEELSKVIQLPDGKKRIRVINGANAAWKWPQQLKLLQLKLNEIDAFITLDGFNEYANFAEGWPLEAPAVPWRMLRAVEDSWVIGVLHFWIKISRKIQMLPVLNKSRLIKLDHLAASKLATFWFLRFFSGDGGKYRDYREMDREKQFEHNLEQYRNYLQQAHELARNRKIKILFFLQPIPLIGKKLSATEVKKSGMLAEFGPDMRDRYQTMVSSLEKSENFAISLLDVFEDVKDDIYRDGIHTLAHRGNEDSGTRLLAKRVILEIKKRWGSTEM